MVIGRKQKSKKLNIKRYHQNRVSSLTFLFVDIILFNFQCFQSHSFPSSNILRIFSSGVPSVTCSSCHSTILRSTSINKNLFSSTNIGSRVFSHHALKSQKAGYYFNLFLFHFVLLKANIFQKTLGERHFFHTSR